MYICVDCGYLDLNIKEYGRFRCVRKYEYHYADDFECSYFCDHKYSSDSIIRYRPSKIKQEAIEYSRQSRNGGCYITTMLVNILNMEDDCEIMETMRDFRDNVLSKDKKYFPLLLKYDVLGPEIASALYYDKNNKIIAKNALSTYIKPTVSYIQNKEYDKAVATYESMTEGLRIYYAIKELSITPYLDYPISNLGHGKIRTLKKD